VGLLGCLLCHPAGNPGARRDPRLAAPEREGKSQKNLIIISGIVEFYML